MFRELSPLLAKRSLVLTLATVGDDRIRVTITPRLTSKEEAKELAQPFAVEGTAEELDTELPHAIVHFTAEHLSLARSLEQVKANMEAALKEAKDEAAKKVAEAKKGSKTSSSKPVLPETKAEVKRPAAPSLFDAPSEPVSLSSTARAAAPARERAAVGIEGSDEDEIQATSNQRGKAPSDVVAETAAQPSFSTVCSEEEILQEAFYGTEDSHIAA